MTYEIICPNKFVRTQFLGAAIQSYSASVGWNTRGSGDNGTLQVELIEDDCNGGGVAYSNNGKGDAYVATVDKFLPPQVGTAVRFRHGAFNFSGILTGWSENDSVNGLKYYTVNLTDSSLILDATKVIINDYTGITYQVPNLLNVYGWLEENLGAYCAEPLISGALSSARGFGGANNSGGGLPWSQIKLALLNLINRTTYSRFGRPLSYRDVKYYIDLSQMPNLDDNVKIGVGGDSISLLDIIAEVCELAAYDYFVELTCSGTTNIIKIRTFDRSRASADSSAITVDEATTTEVGDRLNLGSIGDTVDEVQRATSKRRGIELVKDKTIYSFLVGDYRAEIWQTTLSGSNSYTATIWPYWGKDDNGDVIRGEGVVSATTGFGDHYFWVDATNWGIPGLTRWKIDIGQLRAAMSPNAYDEWITYTQLTMLEYEKYVVQKLAMNIADNNKFKAKAILSGKFEARDVLSTKDTVFLNANLITWHFSEQIFNHVRFYANEYFGKKFMVKLPYLCYKIDADAGYKLTTNWDTTSGGWVSGGSVLGLSVASPLLQAFKEQDGKIQGFVYFESSKYLELGDLSASDVIQTSLYQAYVKCDVEEIVHLAVGDSRAVISLPGRVSLMNREMTMGDKAGYAAIVETSGLNAETKKKIKAVYEYMDKAIGSDQLYRFLMGMPLMPIAAAVPLLSKRLSYGPWAATAADAIGDERMAGKTEYLRDMAFTPWNFGGSSIMNNCGNAYVLNRVSDKYVVEQGEVEVAELPTKSLGDMLVSGGPHISGLEVGVSPGENVDTTKYRMKTYQPDMTKLLSSYISYNRRMGNRIQSYVRNIHSRIVTRYQQWTFNMRSNLDFAKSLIGLPLRYMSASSHDMLIGKVFDDPTDEVPGASRISVRIGRWDQMLDQIGKDNYTDIAGVDMSSLFVPFSTKSDGALSMPQFERCTDAPDERGEDLKEHTLWYSKETHPPVLCVEPKLPIVMETLSPFMNDNAVNGLGLTSSEQKGHNIEYVVRDSIFPTDMNIRMNDDYSTTHNYRAIALRGPLVLAGWGYDLDGRPVPNREGDDGKSLYFADNWLRKPDTWKCGPVDLRWDERRKVWTAPSPMKIALVELMGPAISGYNTRGRVRNGLGGNISPYLNDYNNNYRNEEGEVLSDDDSLDVVIYNPLCGVGIPGTTVTAFWDTDLELYIILSLPRARALVSTPSSGDYTINNFYNDECATSYVSDPLLYGEEILLDDPLGAMGCLWAWVDIYGANPDDTDELCEREVVITAIYKGFVIASEYNEIELVADIGINECEGPENNVTMPAISGWLAQGACGTYSESVTLNGKVPADEYVVLEAATFDDEGGNNTINLDIGDGMQEYPAGNFSLGGNPSSAISGNTQSDIDVVVEDVKVCLSIGESGTVSTKVYNFCVTKKKLNIAGRIIEGSCVNYTHGPDGAGQFTGEPTETQTIDCDGSFTDCCDYACESGYEGEGEEENELSAWLMDNTSQRTMSDYELFNRNLRIIHDRHLALYHHDRWYIYSIKKGMSWNDVPYDGDFSGNSIPYKYYLDNRDIKCNKRVMIPA